MALTLLAHQSLAAPVVKWTQEDQEENQDRWSRTYVTKDKSPASTDAGKNAPLRPSITGNGTNRFPRPHSNSEPPTNNYKINQVFSDN